MSPFRPATARANKSEQEIQSKNNRTNERTKEGTKAEDEEKEKFLPVDQVSPYTVNTSHRRTTYVVVIARLGRSSSNKTRDEPCVCVYMSRLRLPEERKTRAHALLALNKRKRKNLFLNDRNLTQDFFRHQSSARLNDPYSKGKRKHKQTIFTMTTTTRNWIKQHLIVSNIDMVVTHWTHCTGRRRGNVIIVYWLGLRWFLLFLKAQCVKEPVKFH